MRSTYKKSLYDLPSFHSADTAAPPGRAQGGAIFEGRLLERVGRALLAGRTVADVGPPS